MDRRVFFGMGALAVVALHATPLLAGGEAQGTVAKAEEDVRRAERERFAAMLKADVGALDKLLGADLTYTHGDGRVIDKTAFISDFKAGAFKYVTIGPNDLAGRLFGDVA